MAKRKKKDYTKAPWTPFEERPVGDPALYGGAAHAPNARASNSRYDVGLWYGVDPTLGRYVHLSIKDHGRSAKHDWRDFQRIKNELVGPEFEAIEIYPAESRLVDGANQYHLWVFESWRIPVGFTSRLVSDGVSKHAPNAVQRPFETRPADCLNGAQFDALIEQTKAERLLTWAEAANLSDAKRDEHPTTHVNRK